MAAFSYFFGKLHLFDSRYPSKTWSSLKITTNILQIRVATKLTDKTGYKACLIKLSSMSQSSFNTKNVEERIDVCLIKKSWFPKYVNKPKDDAILEEWDGTVADAYKILSNEELPVYDSFCFPLKEAPVLFTDEKYGYDPLLPTIVAMQTMTGTRDSFFTKNTIRALAMRNFVKHYNLFNLRFPRLQKSIKLTVVGTYLGLHGNYDRVSKALSSFFLTPIHNGLMNPEQINLIGYSYSAQLAGYTAREILAGSGRKIHSIVGLDPYVLGAWKRGVVHLSKTDAKTVQVIHTNSFMWGTLEERATADIVINNGNLQPGCTSILGFLPCSHARAAPIFWYIVLFKSKFEARVCPTYWKFRSCKCETNPSALISYPLNESAQGTYYLTTLAKYPFGKGEEGSRCRVKKGKSRRNKE